MPFMRWIVLLSMLFCALSLRMEAQDDAQPSAADAALIQQKVREWVKVRKLIAEESAQWNAEKGQLAELNALREKELKQLDEYITAAGKRVKEGDAERQKLLAQEATLRSQRKKADETITALESQLREQIGRFPTPLRKNIPDALNRLENPTSDAALQDRWRDLLAILGSVANFQNTVTTATEMQTLDGVETQVDALYLGLCQAYYVSRNNQHAGIGMSETSGWKWTASDDLASRIRQAINIADKSGTPEFIKLPLNGNAK